jgi:hypothetical protein
MVRPVSSASHVCVKRSYHRVEIAAVVEEEVGVRSGFHFSIPLLDCQRRLRIWWSVSVVRSSPAE